MTFLGAALLVSTLAQGAPADAAAGPPVAVLTARELKSALRQHRGRVVVLHLWATWCDACVAELPLVGALVRDAKARGIDVVSASLDEPSGDGVERVTAMLRERGGAEMTRTIVRVDDPDAFVAQIDPRWEGSIPAFFAYDRHGRLRHTFVGELTRSAFDRFVADLVRAK